MSIYDICALAGAMLILAVTPGPGVFATVSKALNSGFVPATAVIAGIMLGDLIFLLLAIYGLVALAEMLGELFAVVKYVGGLYLVWLGYQIWKQQPQHPSSEAPYNSRVGNFTTGLLITLGNPKIILFYLVFLPAFMNLNALSTADVLIVAMVVLSVLGSVMLTYAYIAAKAKDSLYNSKSEKYLNRIAASVMASAGIMILAKN